MKKIIRNVEEVVELVVKHPKHVHFDEDKIKTVAGEIKESGASVWTEQSAEGQDIKAIAFKELIAGAINYCYWYGGAIIRPCDACANRMYDLLEEAFSGFQIHSSWKRYCKLFYELLVENRFPLLEERYRHIMELISNPFEVEHYLRLVEEKKGEEVFDWVVNRFPGYASDIFLKRAQLLLMQLNRKLGYFDEVMDSIKVPADYQLPKLLHYKGCIDYSTELHDMIRSQQLIPKGSLMEVEIRATTIKVGDRLASEAGVNSQVVDSFLWQSRKECSDSFHLTVTTDY